MNDIDDINQGIHVNFYWKSHKREVLRYEEFNIQKIRSLYLKRIWVLQQEIGWISTKQSCALLKHLDGILEILHCSECKTALEYTN